jgi:hypothetical protein
LDSGSTAIRRVPVGCCNPAVVTDVPTRLCRDPGLSYVRLSLVIQSRKDESRDH